MSGHDLEKNKNSFGEKLDVQIYIIGTHKLH